MGYPTFYQKSNSLTEKLTNHLNSWGLRRFSDETSFFQWQKEVLAEHEIAQLNLLGQARGEVDDPEADIIFYDLAAQPKNLPVLYSQRYDYYREIGCAITDRIEPASRVLDFGCGVGILTTFYAWCFPHIRFVGIDRSPGSLARARDEAAKQGLSNVQFEVYHLPTDGPSDSFDLIISTQTLFQAENDPGLPSRSWKTFERADDPMLQAQGEIRTGLKGRLDSLSTNLSLGGRILLFEKTWHLGRRILLQRALASRGYRLVKEPIFFRYQSIDEIVQEGPLFEVSHGPNDHARPWKEELTIEPGESLYRCQGEIVEEFISSLPETEILQTISLGSNQQEPMTVTFVRWGGCLAYGLVKSPAGFRGVIIGSPQDEKVIRQYFIGAERWTEEEKTHMIGQLWPQLEGQGDETGFPIYESHTAVAQNVWALLPNRHIQDQKTFREQNGREMHIEWGTCGPLTYMYWANTYDQRQLVLMPPRRAKVLQDYYQESLAEMKRETPENEPEL